MKIYHAVFVLSVLLNVSVAKAHQSFFVFDNGLTDIPTAEDQAKLLKELGYGGMCTRPQHATDELFAAFDKQGLRIWASYLVLPAQQSVTMVPPKIKQHIQKIGEHKSLVWLSLTNEKASDEDAVAVIREVCDLAHDHGLEVVLYPHVKFKTNTLKTCERLRQAVNRANLGLSFTLCHFLAQNEMSTLEAILRMAAPHLKLVQLSGADAIPQPTPDWKALIQPLGQGSFDVGRIFRCLDEIGYQGPVNLQCYKVPLPAKEHLSMSMQAWKVYQRSSKRPKK